MTDERYSIDYLRDILDAVEKAEKFIAGVDFESFVRNDEKVFAIIRALEVVGEATKNIPDDVRTRYPHVPWREMAGLRDILIHQYFGVHIHRIWTVVHQDLPAVKEAIQEIISDIEREADPR